jgi:hypothetical protein
MIPKSIPPVDWKGVGACLALAFGLAWLAEGMPERVLSPT